MEPIQRYNQGFGVFGPLEKCDTGKLAFYADMEAEYSRLLAQAHNETCRRADAEAYSERRTKQIYDLTDANTTLRNRIGELENNYSSLEQEYCFTSNRLLAADAELATTKRDKKVWVKVSWLLAGFIIGAAIGKAFF